MPAHTLHYIYPDGFPHSPKSSGGSPASPDQALELLTRALAAGVVSGPVLLELAYYAAEPDLLGLMRLIAALDPEQRAHVHALAQAMHAEAGPAVS